jgi:anti-sigma B factor antagonist
MRSGAHPFQVRTDAEGVLWLSGELDMAEADSFVQGASASVDGQRELVLDMSELTFLDSSGIRAIFQFTALVRDKGVVIRNPSGPVRKTLEIAGVGEGRGVRIEPQDPPPAT